MPRARLSLCTGKRQAIGATWGKSTLGRQWRELRREHAPLLDLRWGLALPLPRRRGGLVTDFPAVNEHACLGTQLSLRVSVRPAV